MPNIQDYVLWRGDLPLERVPLCDVDALLLSYLSYMPYDNIVGDAFDGGISLRDAAQKLLEVNERLSPSAARITPSSAGRKTST